MQISNLLLQMENQWFVGREKELHTITETCINSSSWILTHIYGPAGIGKTTILKRLMALNPNHTFVYLSGLEGYHNTDDFLSDLADELKKIYNLTSKLETMNQLCDTLNVLSNATMKIILLFDSFELWDNHKWLREKWIPMMSTNVRIITASRFPLPTDWQRSSGWPSLIETIEITTLKKKAVQHYLDLRNIYDANTRYFIEYYSKGVPLALRNICDIVVGNNGVLNERNDELRQLFYYVSEQLLSTSDEISQFKDLIKTASLFWWFDYELLSSVYEMNIETHTFHRFCQIPYIQLNEERGWRIRDPIRQWLSMDISIRDPDQHDLLLKKAIPLMKKKIAQVPASRKQQYILNVLHLTQTGYIKGLGFGASNQHFSIGPVEETDIPLLMIMFQRYVISQKPFLPDKWQQDKYFLQVWKAQPSSFVGVRMNDKLVGFLAFVPLNQQTRPLFLQNPVFQDYIRQTTYQQKEYILWLMAADTNYDPDVTAFILRYIFSKLVEDSLINVVSATPDFSDLLRSLGFTSVKWYDRKFTNDFPMEFFQLDLRIQNFSTIITRSLEDKETETSSSNNDDIILLVKKIVVSYQQPKSEQLIQELISTVPCFKDIPSPDYFRVTLLGILKKWESGSQEEQLHGKIINLAYIRKEVKHEALAVRLNLSASTYYRYVKKAVEKLTQALIRESTKF